MIKGIVAVTGEKKGIGYKNNLPWKISDYKEDMRFFKTTTTGSIVVMGANNYKSIGKPLKDRINIVVSRSMAKAPEGFILCRSREEVLAIYNQNSVIDMFIIGGSQIYELFKNDITEWYVSVIKPDTPLEVDTFFTVDLNNLDEDNPFMCVGVNPMIGGKVRVFNYKRVPATTEEVKDAMRKGIVKTGTALTSTGTPVWQEPHRAPTAVDILKSSEIEPIIPLHINMRPPQESVFKQMVGRAPRAIVKQVAIDLGKCKPDDLYFREQKKAKIISYVKPFTEIKE